ncbi:MAG: ribokinase, partial [Christensenellales bacterium]
MKKVVVIGSINMDLVVNVDAMPRMGESLVVEGFELIPGGKGANQAVALGKLGADVSFLGAVGADDYAKMLLASMSDSGVDTSRILAAEDAATGMALITVSNITGDNSIIVIQGANLKVSKAYVDANMDAIEQADIVIMQMEIPIDTVIHAARRAKALGKTVILDPAPAPKAFPWEILPYVDYIKPNQVELEQITGMPAGEDTIKASSDKLKEAGAGCVLVTLGEDGVFVNEIGGTTKTVPAVSVKAVDTTAAGDCFTAAFAFGLISGMPIIDAVSFATRAAGISVSRKG